MHALNAALPQINPGVVVPLPHTIALLGKMFTSPFVPCACAVPGLRPISALASAVSTIIIRYTLDSNRIEFFHS